MFSKEKKRTPVFLLARLLFLPNQHELQFLIKNKTKKTKTRKKKKKKNHLFFVEPLALARRHVLAQHISSQRSCHPVLELWRQTNCFHRAPQLRCSFCFHVQQIASSNKQRQDDCKQRQEQLPCSNLSRHD